MKNNKFIYDSLDEFLESCTIDKTFHRVFDYNKNFLNRINIKNIETINSNSEWTLSLETHRQFICHINDIDKNLDLKEVVTYLYLFTS